MANVNINSDNSRPKSFRVETDNSPSGSRKYIANDGNNKRGSELNTGKGGSQFDPKTGTYTNTRTKPNLPITQNDINVNVKNINWNDFADADDDY